MNTNKNKYSNIVDTIEGNVCDDLIITTIKRLYNNIDEIYHLASLESPKYYKIPYISIFLLQIMILYFAKYWGYLNM